MADTNIEWTHIPGYTGKSWNPVTGCTKIAAGCKHCYAETLATRFWGDRKFTDVRTHADRLDEPLRRRKATCYFVNSMSDLFHEDVPFKFIAAVYGVMAACPQHIFIVLTKRPERMLEFFEWCEDGWETINNHVAASGALGLGEVPGNDPRAIPFDPGVLWPIPWVWHGTSISDQKTADANIPVLLQVPSAVRFVSAEPLLGPVDFSKWIGYNPPYEINGQDRGVRVPSGGGRDIRDQRAGRSVARSPEAAASGPDNERRVPVGEDYAAREASDDGSAQAGMAALPRRDSAGSHDQPQERRQARQQTGEPRTGDMFAADTSRGACAQSRANGASRRGSQPQRETQGGGGEGNPPQASSGGEPHGAGASVRGVVSDGLESGTRRAVGLHQIITGGESGPGARPCDVAWIRSIVEQCKAASVPCFVKQLGSNPLVFDSSHAWGGTALSPCDGPGGPDDYTYWRVHLKDKKGGNPNEWEAGLRVREWPTAK